MDRRRRRRPYGYAPLRFRRHHRLTANGILMAIGSCLVTAGILVGLSHGVTEERYRKLARTTAQALPAKDPASIEATKDPTVADSPTRNWRQLLEENDEIGAWVCVEGTDIDLPVMTCTHHDGSYYLCHDLWGNYAFEGVPFLDHRCEPQAMHRLVYGHRLSMGGQFSELQKAYEQEVFSTLGTCHWHLPDGSATALRPAFSLSVDMWFEDIQRFDFSSVDDLRAWLKELYGQATARSDDCESLISQAASALTLVTCSSDYGHREWRTLVVFVEVPDG